MKLNLSMTFLSIVLLALVQSAVAADLIFTAPPREKPAEGEKLYGPIVRHLSELLGRKVVYEHPRNWLNYQRDMRKDKYDIIFDGPHFISWRMAHLGHEVLVKLPGTLEFYLVTKKTELEFENVNNLVAKKICGISPPNLSILSVIAAYPNPVRQPVIKGIRGGMKAVHKSYVKDEKCRAAVLRSTFFKKKLDASAQNALKIIFRSTPLPNQGVSVSRRLSVRDKDLLIKSLTFGDGARASEGLLKRFGGKAKGFVNASKDEYYGHNMLLEGVIFGW